jgi:PTS system mannose-specific IIA component
MIGLVLVTHGRLANEFRAALEHVVGAQERLETISIGADDDMEMRRKDIVEAVGRVGEGDGVIVLTDMFGGTPSNLAISIMDAPGGADRVEVIAGLNLPMLIKLARSRGDMPLDALVAAAQEAGRKYINVASALLGQKTG